jgi:hypothetical protein
MPTGFVTTKPNHDSVLLSVDAHSSMVSTSIFINGNWIKTIDGSFNDYYLGTNVGLKGNNIILTSQVARFPSSMTSSTVDFYIDGAASVDPSNPITSTKDFQNSAPNVPHFMTYYFI